MKKTKQYSIIYIFILMFLFCQCTDKTTTTLPFTYNEYGHIIIPVTVGDTVLNFVFDTGVSLSSIGVLNKPSKLQLTDSCVEVSMLVSVMKKDKERMSAPVDITFNDLVSAKNISFAVYDTITKDIADSVNVIGMNIVNQFFWNFDFFKKLVTISTEPLVIPQNSHSLSYFVNPHYTNFTSLKISDSSFVANLDTGFATNIIKYDADSTKIIIADTNVILTYLTKDESSVKAFAKRLNRDDADKYYHTYRINFDSISINKNWYKGKDVSIYVYSVLPESYDKKLIVTINFFKQYEQMYIDTKAQTIYLSPYESTKTKKNLNLFKKDD
jgi:hypothetical protein